jgi:parallel beta-helix repeat protein
MTSAALFARTLLAVGVLSAASVTLRGAPPTLVVDDDLSCARAAFRTIQAAVAAAQPGATIRVCAGDYTENVTISTPLKLVAKPGDVTVHGIIVVSKVNDVEIDGFVVDVVGTRTGIIVEVTQRVVIQNTTVFNGANAGIEIFESDDTLVTKSTTHDNAREGLRLIEAFDAEVRDNISYDNGADGILVNEGANNVVRSNEVTNNGLSGISVCVDTRLNRVEHNTATGNGTAGIAVCSQASGTALTNNRAMNNKVDALDESTGTGTAGTDSYWKNNFCDTSNPTGLCRSTGR